jgi:Clostripain family
VSVRPWRILLYAMVGNDAERVLILNAIGQMSSALQTDDCAIAVQINARPYMERHWITGSGTSSETTLAAVDGSDKAELTRFIDEGSSRLDATSTALIIWAHGEGVDVLRNYVAKTGVWQRDITTRWPKDLPIPARELLMRYRESERLGPDWGTQGFLTNNDVRLAIAESSRSKVDLLGFNACVMGMLEVAFEMRDVTEVLAFSQLFARTWPYSAIVNALSRGPAISASDLGKLIVSCVSADLATGARDDAVSAVATGSLNAVLQSIDPYALRVTSLVSSDWKAVRRAVMQTVQRAHDPYQADLLSLLGVLGAGDSVASAAAQKTLALLQGQVVLGSAAPASHPKLQGLSIFCPKTTKVNLDAAYAGFAFRKSKWTGFVRQFQKALREEAQPGVRAALG